MTNIEAPERLGHLPKNLVDVYVWYSLAALDRFVRGDRDVAFPEGTWLMRRRFGVRCEPIAAT